MKKLFAMVLLIALIFTCFAGCHEKGEIAVTVGDVNYTSGYYACALVFADTEARSKVEEELTAAGESTTDINYYGQKIDDTDYVKWVENTALDTLKELAIIKSLCKKAELTLSDETVSLSDSNAEYLWDSYGYAALMQENGVSEATFKEYMQDTYLYDEYFKHIYGKDGEKAIAADKISKQLDDNYVLVNQIEVSFSDLSEDEKTEKRNQMTAYESELKAGSKSFEEIYLEYNEISADEHTHEEAAEGELEPQDHHATVLGAEDTQYESEHYKTAKDMTVGEVKLVTLDDDAGLLLLVKKDISADPYYLETFDTMLRQDIAGDDFDKDIQNKAKEAKYDINKYSTNQFKVKKIVYPE